MKNIITKLVSLTSRLCMAGLALLGFGCSDENENNMLCMYGTPTAEFEIKGAVTDAEGNAVPDAEIRVVSPTLPSYPYSVLRGNTDASGSFNCSGTITGYPKDGLKVVCLPGDTGLEADSVVVQLEKTKGSDGFWYLGKGEASVDFRLKKKTAE